MPLIIGVTGSIASGKSTACKLLESQGIIHCDADKLVHRMYDPGKPAFDRIVSEFGTEVVGADGFIDRKRLGSKVFGDSNAMSRLTTAIGDIKKEVTQVMRMWRDNLADNDVALMEAVNFLEAGYGMYSDLTWLFTVKKEVAVKRLMRRNNLDRKDANIRIDSQIDWHERQDASDLITHNNDDLESFKQRVLSTIAEVKQMRTQGSLKPSKYGSWWAAR